MFEVGDKVVWLYWPPDAKYRYWQRVDGVVVGFAGTTPRWQRVKVEVKDGRGNKFTRLVQADRLMALETFERDEHDAALHGDGVYPMVEKRKR